MIELARALNLKRELICSFISLWIAHIALDYLHLVTVQCAVHGMHFNLPRKYYYFIEKLLCAAIYTFYTLVRMPMQLYFYRFLFRCDLFGKRKIAQNDYEKSVQSNGPAIEFADGNLSEHVEAMHVPQPTATTAFCSNAIAHENDRFRFVTTFTCSSSSFVVFHFDKRENMRVIDGERRESDEYRLYNSIGELHEVKTHRVPCKPVSHLHFLYISFLSHLACYRESYLPLL